MIDHFISTGWRGHRNQRGFTLVELAISLTVIGLLLAAVMKGQEIVTNTRVNNLVRQTKSYDAGATMFMDSYRYYPGDIRNPGDVLGMGCIQACSRAGNGDNMIHNITAAPYETYNFFPHLSHAQIIPDEIMGGGSNPASDNTNNPHLLYPQTIYKKYLKIAYKTVISAADGSAHWYTIIGFPPRVLYQLDQKYDDAAPETGSFRITGSSCPVSGGQYVLSNTTSADNCELNIKADF